MSDEVLATAPPSAAAQIRQKLIHDDGWKPDARPAPETDWKLNPAKGGGDYDDCPRPECGTRDVAPSLHIEGVASKYCCPDCRVSWNRNSAARHEQLEQNGTAAYSAARRTQEAATGRVYIIAPNSEAYRDSYSRIFGHD